MTKNKKLNDVCEREMWVRETKLKFPTHLFDKSKRFISQKLKIKQSKSYDGPLINSPDNLMETLLPRNGASRGKM